MAWKENQRNRFRERKWWERGQRSSSDSLHLLTAFRGSLVSGPLDRGRRASLQQPARRLLCPRGAGLVIRAKCPEGQLRDGTPHLTPGTAHSKNEQEGPRQSCGQSRALPPHPAPSQATAPKPECSQAGRSAVRVSFMSTSGLFLRQRPVQAQPSWGLRP